MHTDRQVLEALRSRLTPDELTGVLRRVLRVPEAWASLRDPATLEQVIASDSPANLKPADLAAVSLGGSIAAGLQANSADPHEERARVAWEGAELGAIVERDLFEVALLGLEFARRARADNDPEALIELACASPPIWASPLAIGWSILPDPAAVLRGLIEQSERHMALQIVLSNLPPDQAVSPLMASTNGSTLRMLQEITRGDEYELARALTVSNTANPDRLSPLLIKAIGEHSGGALDEARQSLQNAWDTASEIAAQVADFTADQAKNSQDPVTELEARRRALEIMPTPGRRAATAVGLMNLQRSGEAISLLSGSENLSVEERIASGMAHLQLDPGGEHFKQALRDLEGQELLDDDWFVMLIEGLQAIGEWSGAVDAAELRTQRRPASSNARFGYASALYEAGDHERAAEQADITLALDPGSLAAKELLGEIEGGFGQSSTAGANSKGFEASDRETVTRMLTEAVQVNPSSAAARLELAQHLKSAGRLSEALESAKAAAEIDRENPEIAIELAQVLIELGHADEATDVLRELTGRRPLSWKVALVQAKLFERRGDIHQAFHSLREIPASAPPDDHLHAARISLRAGVGGLALARTIQALESMERSGHTDPYLDHWYATALERTHRYEEAIARYEVAQKEIPQDDLNTREEAALGVARTARALGQVSLSLSTLEHAQAEFPLSARVLASAADTYHFAKLPDKAQEAAEQAVQLDPEEPLAWKALGLTLAETGDFNGSVRAIERLSTLDPNAVEGWMLLAELAAGANQERVVRRAVAEAVWRGRRNAEALQTAAQFQHDQGASHSAIRIMKAANRQRPEDQALLARLAELYESTGDYDAAYEVWGACSELTPHSPEVLRRLARSAANLGLRKSAVKAFKSALALDPSNVDLRRDLAAAYVEQGQVSKGLSTYLGAVKEAANDADLAREAIEAALLAGDPRQALGMVSRARDLVGDSEWIYAALGEAYLLLDKPDQAEVSLAEGLEQGFKTARTLSMLAIATPDHRAAKDCLDQARAQSVDSAHEAVWVARAELRFFNWSAALAALEGWTHPNAVLERARCALRTRDARWLLQTSEASLQDPPTDLAKVVNEALNELDSREIDDSLSVPLKWWAQLSERSSDGIEWVEGDATGWLGEGEAIAHLRAGRHVEARESVGLTRQVFSRALWCDILEGLGFEAESRPEDARASFRKSHSSSPLAGYLLGRSYSQANSLERAIKYMGAAVIQMPGEPQWQYRLASAYLELGDSDSALAHLQEACAIRPEDPTYLVALAKAYRDLGQQNEALDAYGAALQFEKDSIDTYRDAGQIALEVGQLEKAAEWFERACTLAPSDASSLIGSAQAEMARGRRQLAEQRLASAIRMAPDDSAVLLGMGRIQALMGDSDAALQSYAEALKAGAEPIQVHRSRSKALASRGQTDLAAQALREALDQAPDDHALWHQLGLTLEVVSDYRPADEAVTEAVRISPRNSEYRLTLGRIARKAGNLDRAIDELRQAGQASPSDPRIAIETGRVYEDRRDYSRALEAYSSAIETDPTCVDAYYRAGLLLRTIKSYKRAGEMLKHAADLAPVNQEVLHQLAAVRALELVHG